MMKTIRQFREERGESEMQLADALSATRKDIQDLEKGSPAHRWSGCGV
jgi:DNA-binding XRE family transcriptional regulator